jgi:hemoglobin/transferrin/lactoferrin receptor protein
MVRSATLLVAFASVAAAQTRDTTKARPLAAVTVTATRTERSAFDTPMPVATVDSAKLAELLVNGVADAFKGIAGLDASGVGPNQRRPEIRGQRGQRILLLSDGLRLNNARRQSDFGELPAIAGLSSLDRVEVVRGPASVLYGTDAIGGVVNLISADAPASQPSGEIHGAVRYRYGSVGASSTPDVMLATRAGKLGVRIDASARDASTYKAPSGKFGDINLTSAERVNDSGVRDGSGRLALNYSLSGTSEIFARGEMYSARDAGFGFIDPSKLGANQPTIQILYPDQDYTRYTLGIRSKALSTPFANRVEVSTYAQRNFRHLKQFILIPAGPGATITTNAFNYTDLSTFGARAELAKSFGSSTLTYGVDGFRDRSRNTDTSETVVVGFGPTQTQSSNRPSVPNATFGSAGMFAQFEFQPVKRLTAVVGTRGQVVSAETKPTPNVTGPTFSGTDRTAVWSANALYRLRSDLNLVATVGRGFRSPNLVERFFNGPTPEGNAFQKASPKLAAETSINSDLGVRFRRDWFYGEGFVFRNTVSDAIRAVATGNTVGGQPEFENRNVGKLRVDGLEMLGGTRIVSGLDANVSWTRLLGKNISNPGSPIGDTYSSKIVGDASYSLWSDRVSVGYNVRWQGEQKDVIVGSNPIGSVLPAFTVHSARASIGLNGRGSMKYRLAVVGENLGNKLYAEFPNASFFRPEPGRSFTVALTTAF